MKNKAVFFDKDGTLVDNIPYNVNPLKIRLTEGAINALSILHHAKYLIFVVTNQPGIALGLFTLTDLDTVQIHLRKLLNVAKIPLAGFLYCPHHPKGTIATFAIHCTCRKPAPGLLLQAAIDYQLDLEHSWLVGDILDDIEAGRRAGCQTVLLNNGNETEWLNSPLRQPTSVVSKLSQAAAAILESTSHSTSLKSVDD